MEQALRQEVKLRQAKGVSNTSFVALITAKKGVKMGTIQVVQQLLNEVGILKIQYDSEGETPSAVLVF